MKCWSIVDARRHRRRLLVWPRRCRRAGGSSLLGGGHWQQRDRRRRRRVGRSAGLLARRRAAARVLGRRQRADVLRHGRGRPCENREGGTRRRRSLADDRRPYREALDTRRFDAGAVGQTLVAQRYVADGARAPSSQQRHDHRSAKSASAIGTTRRSAKSPCAGPRGRHTWVAGVAVERDAYRPQRCPAVRLHVHRARRVRAGRRRRLRRGCRCQRERSPRSSQRIRHVLQPAVLGAAAIGRVDQPGVGRHGILRAVAADRRNRSGRTVAADDSACRCGRSAAAAPRSTSRARDGPVSYTVDVVRVA